MMRNSPNYRRLLILIYMAALPASGADLQDIAQLEGWPNPLRHRCCRRQPTACGCKSAPFSPACNCRAAMM